MPVIEVATKQRSPNLCAVRASCGSDGLSRELPKVYATGQLDLKSNLSLHSGSHHALVAPPGLSWQAAASQLTSKLAEVHCQRRAYISRFIHCVRPLPSVGPTSMYEMSQWILEAGKRLTRAM